MEIFHREDSAYFVAIVEDERGKIKQYERLVMPIATSSVSDNWKVVRKMEMVYHGRKFKR
ncbi:hypothetical protein [Pseudanabaena sp. ABRG5-3]|uniref:hypothetical protein n=1 Tax=Pseudanabaena sp. ABRG5-3 TaxID=685565 RepID=UPI000F821B00|nr:hypothetical protein [Pseudanabaena sp. ABRG5-3]